jgi:hypothetical protein
MNKGIFTKNKKIKINSCYLSRNKKKKEQSPFYRKIKEMIMSYLNLIKIIKSIHKKMIIKRMQKLLKTLTKLKIHKIKKL